MAAASLAEAVLENGAGNYERAVAAATDAAARDHLALSGWALPELVEAAVRSGDEATAADALARLGARANAAGTDWALGVHAASTALLAGDLDAEQHFREAIGRLSRTEARLHLGRTQLCYGEWLRRRHRRIDARLQLRAAIEVFTAAAAEAFVERAQSELRATGEKARKRSVDKVCQLTPQESRIAYLARDGLTNPEIGATLFVSPRTVEYHLRKVFAKLAITSRNQLHLVLDGTYDARGAATAS